MIELITIIVLTFALAMIVIGAVTVWLERERARMEGVVLILVGLLVGAGYAFLGSRFAQDLFGRLIVAVDFPKLMLTAFTYTAGVLIGAGMATVLFLWATSRFREHFERTVLTLVIGGLLVSALATAIAVLLSKP